MKSITLFRKIIEDIEICDSFEIENNNHTTTIYFQFTDPVDTIIWTIQAEYFRKHLKQYFERAGGNQRSIIP